MSASRGFCINVPKIDGTSLALQLRPGETTVFLGANGAGKTRLGVYIEYSIPLSRVRRIAAQRSIGIASNISIIEYERAQRELFYGNADHGNDSNRNFKWSGHPEVAPLNDYGALLQALFAEHAQIAVADLMARHQGVNASPRMTKLLTLKRVWESILPEKTLVFSNAAAKVGSRSIKNPGPELLFTDPSLYQASQMSDGERVIFYLIGQVLLAAPEGVIIIDEPELHIHRSITARLWNVLEAERKDCTFVYITHDLEFVDSRLGAKKFSLKSHRAAPKAWDIEELDTVEGIPDSVVAELLGSRAPILFVEGARSGGDAALMAQIYPAHKVEAIGSCEAVISSVATFRANGHLHRVGDVYGCIDRDGRSDDEIHSLNSKGVFVLPVCEVENVFLLRAVFLEICEALHFRHQESSEKYDELVRRLAAIATRDAAPAAARYLRRRVDAELKKVGLAGEDGAAIASELSCVIQRLNVEGLYRDRFELVQELASQNRTDELLVIYDNKGLLAEAAVVLGLRNRSELLELIARRIGTNQVNSLRDTLRSVFPAIAT